MTDLEKLKAQTEFLLLKQKESQQYCLEQFSDFLSLLNDEIEIQISSGDREKAEKLKKIQQLISEHSQEFSEGVARDIEFLEGQISAINTIEKEKNIDIKNELTKMIIEDQEIVELDQFKKDIEAEAESSKEEFINVLEDFKHALTEGNIDELLIYLQNIAEEQGEGQAEEDDENFELSFDEDDESEDDEECCDEDECCDEEDDESCCGSFPKSGKKGCCRD